MLGSGYWNVNWPSGTPMDDLHVASSFAWAVWERNKAIGIERRVKPGSPSIGSYFATTIPSYLGFASQAQEPSGSAMPGSFLPSGWINVNPVTTLVGGATFGLTDNFTTFTSGDYTFEFWRSLQTQVKHLRPFYIKHLSDPNNSGSIYNFHGHSGYIETWASNEPFPPPSGFTRKRPREIHDTTASGVSGQRAIFRFTSDYWYDPTSPYYHQISGLQFQRFTQSRQQQLIYSNLLFDYIPSSGGWTLSDDQSTPPDITTSYGILEKGDICGPWILNDLQKALNLLVWTFGIGRITVDESFPFLGINQSRAYGMAYGSGIKWGDNFQSVMSGYWRYQWPKTYNPSFVVDVFNSTPDTSGWGASGTTWPIYDIFLAGGTNKQYARGIDAASDSWTSGTLLQAENGLVAKNYNVARVTTNQRAVDYYTKWTTSGPSYTASLIKCFPYGESLIPVVSGSPTRNIELYCRATNASGYINGISEPTEWDGQGIFTNKETWQRFDQQTTNQELVRHGYLYPTGIGPLNFSSNQDTYKGFTINCMMAIVKWDVTSGFKYSLLTPPPSGGYSYPIWTDI